jgi:hypothetical protein
MLLRKRHFSHYSPVTIAFLDQQVHICLKITLHPTSPQQKCLYIYKVYESKKMEFVEWVVIVSVRCTVRAEDPISTLSVIFYVFTLSTFYTYGTIYIYKFLPLSCLALMMLF